MKAEQTEREETTTRTTKKKDADAGKTTTAMITDLKTTIAKTEEIVLATATAKETVPATTTTKNPHLDETGLAIASTKEEIETMKSLRVDGIGIGMKTVEQSLRAGEIEVGIEIIIALRGDSKMYRWHFFERG